MAIANSCSECGWAIKLPCNNPWHYDANMSTAPQLLGSSHPYTPPPKLKARWRLFGVAEMRWRKWEFGFGLYFGEWFPREYSISLLLGPVLLQGGLEDQAPYKE